MIEPIKIYEGIHSILRNIVPGLLILSPLLTVEDIKIDNIGLSLLTIIIYIIVTVVSHSLLEGIGYFYLNITLNTENKIIKCIIPFLFIPSYFVYRLSLINKIIEKTNIGNITFEEYRQVQDNTKLKYLFGDHDYIHRINSFMICFDISNIGLSIFLIIILIKKYCKFFYNIDFIKKINILNNFNELIIIICTLYTLTFIIRFLLKAVLIKFEINNFFNGKYDWNSLLNAYRSEILKCPFTKNNR